MSESERRHEPRLNTFNSHCDDRLLNVGVEGEKEERTMQEENKNPQTTHGSEQNEAFNKGGIKADKLKAGLYFEKRDDGTTSVYGVGGDGAAHNLLNSRE